MSLKVNQYGVHCGFCNATISMMSNDFQDLLVIRDWDDVVVINQKDRRVMHRCSTMYVIEELTL